MQVKKCEKMIYNKEAACVYDTIFYCMLDFSRGSYEKYYESTFGLKNPLQYYESVKKELALSPSQELYPFFFRSGKEWCFLSQYHWNEFNNFKDSFYDFINKIKSDKNIKNAVYIYYLKNIYNENTLPINNPSELFNELFNSKLEPDIIRYLISIYYDFDKTIVKLIEYLQRVYEKISQLHINSFSTIDDVVKKYSSKKMLNTISEYCNLNGDIEFTKQNISISLINTYLFLWQGNKHDKYFFILGLSADDIMNSIIYYRNITPEWIGTITSHPVKKEILEHLLQANYSATQLSEILFVSRQTVNFHLLELKANMCIQIVEKRGLELFYSINFNFFEAAHSIMNNYLSKFVKSKNK